jgi:hypothetical protein
LVDVRGLSNNDLLQVGAEIVKITSVNSTLNKVTVDRAQIILMLQITLTAQKLGI